MKKPIILLEGKNTINDLDCLKKNYTVLNVHDIYEQQLNEIFEISNPTILHDELIKKMTDEFISSNIKNKKNLIGNWIYFPWNGNLIHTVNEIDYFKLRTNRNRNLITEQEQQILKKFTVGIVGLSVGSTIAHSLVHQGIANSMKLAEFDNLETTNLNRVQADLQHIGLPKIDITAMQIYDINPYSDLHLFPHGLKESMFDEFIYKTPSPNLIFDIIDDFPSKVKLRIAAKKAQIPVIMIANLGDSLLIDIERYDTNPDLPIFNGILGSLPEDILNNPNENPNKYAIQIVGVENIPRKALDSVKEIGKTLIGRPQLSSTVNIAGGLATYMARQVALKQTLTSGRRKVAFSDIFK